MHISHKLREELVKLREKESGAVVKDPGGRVSVLLIYPNQYKAGMSNLGFQTVYALINAMPGALAERAFLPSRDDLKEYESGRTPLFSLESVRPATDFDIIAFSISFEEDFLNIPKLLALASVPLYSKDRVDGQVVMAGGAAVSLNPEPVADFFDFFLIGDAEASLAEVIELSGGGAAGVEARGELFKELSKVRGVYVPSHYLFAFDGPRISGITPLHGAPGSVIALKNTDLTAVSMPATVVHTPDTEFSSTTLMEVERGCGRGCRFCAAGFLYLPPRERPKEDILKALAEVAEGSAGSAEPVVAGKVGKVGLVGAAVSEYTWLKEILREGTDAGLKMTLSSLRADMLDLELLTLMKASGYKTLTIAPEAGSERMRDVINKGITDEEILGAAKLIAEAGFHKLKLYFMLGLPSETDEDAMKTAEITKKIRKVFKKGSIVLSINPFVPKPCTPFQWNRYTDISVLKRRFKAVKKSLGGIKGVEVKGFSAERGFLQSVLSTGDRRLSAVIERASGEGARKHFKERAFRDFVYRERGEGELLPWELIDHGIRKDYLWKEFVRGLAGKTTPPCDTERCVRCGVCA